MAVHAEGKGGGAVVDDEALEHVAGLVGAYDAAFHDDVLAGGEAGQLGIEGGCRVHLMLLQGAPLGHGVGVVGLFLPVEGLHLGQRVVGLLGGFGHRQIRSVEVVLAGCETHCGDCSYGKCLCV